MTHKSLTNKAQVLRNIQIIAQMKCMIQEAILLDITEDRRKMILKTVKSKSFIKTWLKNLNKLR